MSKLEKVHLNKISQIAVNVQDLERAIAFYRDVLGMRFLFQAPPQMAFFQCGEIRLMLGIAEKPEFQHPASILYYEVEDIDSTHRRLAALGVPFEEQPRMVHRAETQELWLAFFRDSEGNHLALMCQKRIGRK